MRGLIMVSRRKHICRRRPFFAAACFTTCLFIFCFYIVFYINEEKIEFRVLADDRIRGFLVNTSACQIPAWNPWDDSVYSFYKPVSRYKCAGPPSFLRVLPNAIVSLDLTILKLYYEVHPENVSCVYQTISRDSEQNDTDIDKRFKFDKPQRLDFNVPLKVDFIKTECQIIGQDAKPFVEYLPMTPLKHDVEERCVQRQGTSHMQNPLNVIFIGIDSISNLNFLRHFPKCQQYLSDHLSPLNLKGYVKVGDNTFPNLMPLLTGHFHQYYYDEVHNKTMFFDDVDFSWKAFANHGYRTFFAEDAPNIATFNYYRNGFRHPPADYYYRPFALAMEKSELRKKQCFGSKMEMEVLYDYLRSFVDTMGTNRPFFAFLFLARLTHDMFNFAGFADEPTFQLLRYLHDSKVLNNTMFVFYSDHGIRYGGIRNTYIGQFEERMPFMNIILPKWFLEKHQDFETNLKVNSKRLTTPFDIHATMLHLASVISGDEQIKSRSGPGISLFSEIPTNRTCSKAAIAPHWCPCQIRKSVPVTDPNVIKAAHVVIQTLNELTRPYREKCVVLSLSHVLDSRVNEVENNLNSTIREHELDYLIVMSASPSDAILEATVRCDSRTSVCKVIDDISRINEYGKQSMCISDTVLKKFCYCNV